MKMVKPSVFILAETALFDDEVERWLAHMGVPGWGTDAKSDGEALIEMAGRRCYRSFETDDVAVSEQNPNLTKVRESNSAYIENILSVGHGSVLEHATVTFAFEDVSRTYTHELVRHRVGTATSQESLRFVRPTSLNMYFPDVFADLPEKPLTDTQMRAMHATTLFIGSGRLVTSGKPTVRNVLEYIFSKTVSDLEEVQRALVALLGMDEVAKAFGDKKKLQSSMRRLMPIGMATAIVWTANHRTIRNTITMRTSRHAEEEIRNAFGQVAAMCAKRYPALYQDMVIEMVDGHPECTFPMGKI